MWMPLRIVSFHLHMTSSPYGRGGGCTIRNGIHYGRLRPTSILLYAVVVSHGQRGNVSDRFNDRRVASVRGGQATTSSTTTSTATSTHKSCVMFWLDDLDMFGGYGRRRSFFPSEDPWGVDRSYFANVSARAMNAKVQVIAREI